jgi:hemolysin activation/secretion protein
LKEVKDNINNLYFKKGYISARVYFGVSEIHQGILRIVIEEGKIEEIDLQDDSKLNSKISYRNDMAKFFAFPFLKNKTLNLRDIEQGLDQMNRLSSNNATMKIDAGEKAGYSKIAIENKIDHLTNITFSTDNSGNESTGKHKNKIIISQDNLLGLNDNIYINHSTSNNNDKSDKYSKSTYISASIPFGYYTLGGSYSYSKYLLTTIGNVETIRSSGNTESRSFHLDRVLHRGKKHKITLKAELENSDSDNYLEDTFIPISSRRLTSTNFYLNNTFYTKSGTIYLQPSFSKGITAMGALKDAKNLRKKDAKAQYESYGIYGSVSNDFNIPKTKIPLNHQLTFDAQYSKDSLYSNKQFGVGGRYTVRGFEESQVSGDNGYYIRNDLKINSAYLVPDKIKQSKLFNLGSNKQISINNILSKTSVGVFYDYGYARSKVIDEAADEGYMSGAGAKINYSGKYLDWDVTYSKALHSPRFLQNIDGLDDNESIYFNMKISVSLF